MILTKRQIELIDFESTDSWTTDDGTLIEVYKKDDIEVTFTGKQCESIELNEFPIVGISSVQSLEKFINLVYND